MDELIFLKLGGSLITLKDQPHTVRAEVLDQITREISGILLENPGLRLLIGHGSGSFGHVPARKFNTRNGVKTIEQWLGFANVWSEARVLNNLVMESLKKASVPAISFPPSSQVLADNGKIKSWETFQIQSAIHNGLVPVIYGDVVFDHVLGGTILSTEELFQFLAAKLKPTKILLAGLEPGIWRSFPQRDYIVPSITPESLEGVSRSLMGSNNPDVTGGMKTKVDEMMDLIRNGISNQVVIFSGMETGIITKVINGVEIGTRISLDYED